MLNIFPTYRCNLACPYCFARELQQEYRQDMSEQAFGKLLSWMKQAGVHAAAFLGGEPTLHPGLPEMIRQTTESGISVTLFSNGLFPSSLVEHIRHKVTNFVINFNEPGIYNNAHQQELLHQNLSLLQAADCSITFSKNFSPGATEYAYLIEGAERYGVTSIRYDLSRPGSSGSNDYFAAHETAQLMKHVVSFVRECQSRKIKTGLDCCIKFCDLPREDLSYLERVSMKLTGICHPSVDIHPDLSASYCLPMRHIQVSDVTEFASSERLIHHFAAAVRPLRYENVQESCRECDYFMKKCQGGCMATRQNHLTCTQQPETEAATYYASHE